LFFFFQAEDGIRDATVTGVQTCALPISISSSALQTEGRARLVHHGLSDGRVAVILSKPLDRAPGHRPDERRDALDACFGLSGPRSEERRVGRECRYTGWQRQ